MTRSTFMELVFILNVRMERQTTRMHEPVPVEKRVAAALWYLANSVCYRLVSEQFGIGISTAGEIVLEVCFALEVELYSKVVCLGPEIGKIMDGFGHLGFPHCIGAIDGTHVAIHASKRRINEYGNRKYYCSILLQGTVDHTGRFIDTEIGFSGRTNDAFVFNNSNLCATMDAGAFVPGNPTMTIQGVTVPALIIADGAYPIRRWLMKAYQKPRTVEQKNFNLNLCRARNVVERAFGRLKARWRIISGRLNVFPENVSAVVTACVILHNICEERGHAVLQDLPEQHTIIVPDEEMADRNVCARTRAEGQCVRDALATYMYNHACRR